MGGFFSKGFNPDTDVGDLSGRVYIVTGGNAGIGFTTVQHLARHGATVYMAARNEEKANAAIERLHKEGLSPGNGKVVWLKLDLADPRLAKQAAEEFLQKEQRLDVLINNAALLIVKPAKTHDGVQDIVMVNHISNFVFTRTLLPLMQQTAKEPGSDVRIVVVASDGHALVKNGIRFRSIDDFNHEYNENTLPNFTRYTVTKLMNVLTAKELQRRLIKAGDPIIITSLNPGSVNTDGVQNYAHSVGPLLSPLYTLVANAFFADPVKGAYVYMFAAAAPVVRAEKEKYQGAYLQPPGKLGRRESKQSCSEELARELWDTTEGFLKGIGVELPPIEREAEAAERQEESTA